MKPLAHLFAAPLLFVITACTGTLGPAPAPAPPGRGGNECKAADAQFAVGKNADAALLEQARQRSGSRIARVLRPGQMVTMEYSAERLNLDVDASGKVASVRCG
ncbi:MAG: proteinase inhibitor I78 [Ramlibacter sp.]|nr:proteinase inhibitor I78 [Ramlibacter sp.]